VSTAPYPETESVRVRRAYARRDARRNASLYSHFSPANLFRIQECERRMLTLLARHGLSDLGSLKIFEAGCGSGYWIRQFINWGARPENMAGIDILPQRIAEARRLCPSTVRFECQDAGQIGFPAGSFDLIIASTVFSSILDGDARLRVAAETLRLLRPSGTILWYDFFLDNPANPDVKGVPKREIKQLFPGCRLFAERVTLAPPLTRALAEVSVNLCRALSATRIFNTHYLALIRRAKT
jgi:SAM-dependent methyltransferase